MPAPRWFFRFLYDRESAAWARRRDEPAHQELVAGVVDGLTAVVAPPAVVADLGCGPGAHALALAERGYEVVGLDAAPGMVDVARARADGPDVRFEVADVGGRLPFDDGSLGGALAIHVIQHLSRPRNFLTEIRRCLAPGGYLLITAPEHTRRSPTTQSLYWRLRAAFYTLVPGVIRFDDADALTAMIEDAGMTVAACHTEPGRVRVLARA